ncbi:MAG: hypothetical protein ACU0C9_07660, partial [Paracoccaceae bacterium]
MNTDTQLVPDPATSLRPGQKNSAAETAVLPRGVPAAAGSEKDFLLAFEVIVAGPKADTQLVDLAAGDAELPVHPGAVPTPVAPKPNHKNPDRINDADPTSHAAPMTDKIASAIFEIPDARWPHPIEMAKPQPIKLAPVSAVQMPGDPQKPIFQQQSTPDQPQLEYLRGAPLQAAAAGFEKPVSVVAPIVEVALRPRQIEPDSDNAKLSPPKLAGDMESFPVSAPEGKGLVVTTKASSDRPNPAEPDGLGHRFSARSPRAESPGFTGSPHQTSAQPNAPQYPHERPTADPQRHPQPQIATALPEKGQVQVAPPEVAPRVQLFRPALPLSASASGVENASQNNGRP